MKLMKNDSTLPDITGKNRPKRAHKGQFLPGTTGNPKGRPKGSVSITQVVKAKLQEVYSGTNSKEVKTYLEKIVEKILDNGIVKKDARTLKDIWAYIDGQPKASLDFHTDQEKANLEELTAYFRKVSN